MAAHRSVRDVQVQALEALQNLAVCTAAGKQRMLDKGCLASITDAMSAHPSVGDVQANASWALRNLAVAQTRERCDEILEQALEPLQAAMAAHRSVRDVQVQALEALRNLALCTTAGKQRVLDKGCLLSITDAMAAHPNIGDVQELASEALQNLADDGATREQRDEIVEHALEPLMAAMVAYRSKTVVQVQALRALKALALCNAAGKQRMLDKGCLTSITDAMAARRSDGDVQAPAVRALANVVAGATTQQLQQMALLGCREAIHAAIAAHPGAWWQRVASDVLRELPGFTRSMPGVEQIEYQPLRNFVLTVSVDPLKSAVEYFEEEIPKAFPTMPANILQFYLTEGVKTAKLKMPSAKKLCASLDDMDVFVVVVFTMASYGGEDQEFYWLLNDALLKRKTKVLERVQYYLHFFFRALHKIPQVQADPLQPGKRLYRGIPEKDRDAAKKYTEGRTIHWSAFTSVTWEEEVAMQFAGQGGVIFVISARSARLISSISAFTTEEEALLLPNFQAFVSKSLYQKEGDRLGVGYVELIERPDGVETLVL